MFFVKYSRSICLRINILMRFVNVFIVVHSTPATKKQPDIKAALKCSAFLVYNII
ncbi:MAG: hypothetical protein ACJAXS_002265 [Colwellia sp.]|jgi:hypothetical protein